MDPNNNNNTPPDFNSQGSSLPSDTPSAPIGPMAAPAPTDPASLGNTVPPFDAAGLTASAGLNVPPPTQDVPAPDFSALPTSGVTPTSPSIPVVPDLNTVNPEPVAPPIEPPAPPAMPVTPIEPVAPVVTPPADAFPWQSPVPVAPTPVAEPVSTDNSAPAAGFSAGPSISDLASGPSSTMFPPNPESAPANPFMTNTQAAAPLDTSSVAGEPSTLSSNEPPIVSESAPTDLSHLMSSVPVSGPGTSSSIPQPENLVVTPAPTPAPQDAQVVTASGSRGFPKWILAAGGVVLLLVVAGSAYLILGIGQSEVPTASVPATQQPLTNPPKALLPTVVPTEVAGTSSANFANLGGTQAVPQADSTSSAQSGGSSALELLRQRQAR